MSCHRQKRKSVFRGVSGVSMGPTTMAQLLAIFSVLFFLAGCAARPVRIVTPAAVPAEIEASPTYVEVDVSALRHNVAVFKNLLEDDQKLCSVIKTDAYFLGAEHVATAAVAEGADCLCFVSNAEAWQIRQMGLELPLIRIAPGSRDEVTRAVQIGGVEELVGTLGHAEMISQVAQSFRSTRGENFRIPIHINVNMSMARMAIFYESDLEKISNLPGIQVKGLMSHFANAYNKDPDKARKLAFEDMDKFDRLIANFESRDQVTIHIANSQSTVRWPEARRDMVRVGSGILRGMAPREFQDSVKLWPPVVAIKSTVALVMENVPPNSTVGYESTYRTDPDKPSRLAALRFGHANGYPAAARNSGYVLIRGQRFPIIGRISQNTTVVNVTDENRRNPVRMGDEVVILGPQGNDRITINELLEWIGESEVSVGNEIYYSLMVRNPKKAVEGVAAKLHPRHLFCGLCLDEEQ